jgi:hypothetical protein
MLALAIALAGCTQVPSAAPRAPARVAAESDGLELVVGVHANEPASTLPASVLPVLTAAIAEEQSVGIIAVEGRPRVRSSRSRCR